MSKRGPKPKMPDRFTLSARKALHQRLWRYVGEILEHGTAAEVRQQLGILGSALSERRWDAIAPSSSKFLGEALQAIGRGDDPAAALGLTRRHRISIGKLRAQQQAVKDLVQQGVPETKALDIVAQLRERRNADGTYTTYLADIKGAGDKLRKRFKRHLK